MSVERILFPTKFRELSFNSLESLLDLKSAGLKEIILCHVISREDVGFVPFGGYLKEEEERLREEARIRFEDWRKTISEKGIDSRVVIRVGEPVPQVLHAAEDEKADLVIVGQKKKTSVDLPFAESHTLEIVTRSKIPALVSKYMVGYEIDGEHHEKVNDRIFERPMIIVDWSELSRRTLDFLKSLHGAVDSAVVFHGLHVEISKKHNIDDMHRDEKEIEAKLDALCRELKDAGIDAESHIGAGGLLDEIIRVSRERNATMLIIGNTSKQRFLERMLHRSISYQVTKVSELPTVLVP
jgi:nucleotide-binding universal stress UspA family protein